MAILANELAMLFNQKQTLSKRFNQDISVGEILILLKILFPILLGFYFLLFGQILCNLGDSYCQSLAQKRSPSHTQSDSCSRVSLMSVV